MLGLPEISVRRREPELMDDPALDAAEHAAALSGLRAVNRLSRTARSLWEPIEALGAGPGRPGVSVLDIGTGSGDVPAALVARAAVSGRTVEVSACDVSERAIGIARQRDAGRGVRFFRLDAVREPIPKMFDVVMCSLFMHHLDPPDVVELLYKMKSAARRMVIVSDLRRSSAGYALAWAATRLSRSRIVRTDALLSVRAAFTMDEFLGMAEEAGLAGGTIRAVWPCRFLYQWSRS